MMSGSEIGAFGFELCDGKGHGLCEGGFDEILLAAAKIGSPELALVDAPVLLAAQTLLANGST
jgi:hypothetical protein